MIAEEFNSWAFDRRNETRTQFEQQQQQQPSERRSIFTHGLPPLGPLSDTTKFTSNPFVPSDRQHAKAQVRIAKFSALSDLQGRELPYPETSIWTHVRKTTSDLGGYSNEAGVNYQVHKVFDDVLTSLDIREKVIIRPEVEVRKNRPDFMVILVNGHPIGAIEGKQPGEVAMHHENILGEVYDQLMHLSSIFRVNTPFAILTSYEEWRVCWLDNEDSNKIAGCDELPPKASYETPVKPAADKRKRDGEGVALEDKPPTPPGPPPTPSRSLGAGKLQEVDDGDSEDSCAANQKEDDKARKFCSTQVFQWNDQALPMLLVSVIRKMMAPSQLSEPKVLRLANEVTSAWKKAPPYSSLDFNLCISTAVKNFFLWEDLGHGADGRAFLVSGGTKGAVGVLKLFFDEAETKSRHEHKMWLSVYSHLIPVQKTVRVVQVMQQQALLMPWFQCPNRTRSTLDAVEKTLRGDFFNKGIRHDDVAWRNVGVYKDGGGQERAVVFDMQKVFLVEDQTASDDWVQSAIKSLESKLET